MATTINITPLQPVVLSVSNPLKMNLWDAVDVSAFDVLDLELNVLVVGGGLVNVQIDLITGMQKQTEDGWGVVPAGGAWGALPAGSVVLKTFDKGFLKYVRWQCSTGLGGANTATFYLRGQGRRYGSR